MKRDKSRTYYIYPHYKMLYTEHRVNVKKERRRDEDPLIPSLLY
jgi:hypothetical protein